MWTADEIAGKKVDVFAASLRPRFGAIFLHPYGLETLADRPAFTKLLDQLEMACICPHAGHSWWADRVCPEFDPQLTPEQHVVRNIVPAFESRWQLRPRAIAVFGISMGGQGALRLAFKNPRLFPVAAGISSAVDYHERYGQGTCLDEMYDSKEQCRQDTALMHIHPSDHPPHLFFCIDPADVDWYRGNDRLHEKLIALGVAHTCDLTTEAGGHSWTYFDRMAEPTLRFLHAGLEKESRRLL
jgi:S-formylglutathione hydrolase